MTFPVHSLRWRLLLWYGLILLVVVIAFCLTAHRLAWLNQLRRVDRALVQAEHALAGGLMDANRPPREDAQPGEPASKPTPPHQFFLKRLESGTLISPADRNGLFLSREEGYFYYVVAGSNGFALRSANAPELVLPPHSVIAEPTEEFRTTARGARERIMSFPGGLSIIVGHDLSPEHEEMLRFAWSLAAAGLGTWLLSLLGGWWIAGRAMRPVAEIGLTASRISAGNLSERIRSTDTDGELEQLGRVLNRTFDRLADALDRQRRFTADASHELRTPVTILLSETHRALRRERSPEEYRESLLTCQAAATRMRRLVEDLLLLAREESMDATRSSAPCDLADILREVASAHAPLAESRNIKVELQLDPAPCLGAPAELAILAANLLSNAIHHQTPGGSVSLTTGSDSKTAFLTVSDTGPGIPPTDLPHIFERFYRSDKARTATNEGHSGLGLAIAKQIADNHMATLGAENRAPRGARFNLTLPRRGA